MLLLEKPFTPLPGITVYRDHQEANRFYYINGNPRLAVRNGVPALSMTKFRRDLTDNPDFEQGENIGGGVLSLTVDLHLTEDEKDDIKDAIADAFDIDGEVILGQAPFRDGSVQISGMDEENEAQAPDGNLRIMSFEKVYSSSKPSLIGDNSATFTMELGMEQATYFEQVLRGNGTSLSVFYDLKYVGLSPAFEVKVTADYSRIYNSLEAKFGVQAQIKAVSLATDVEAAFEHLRDDGSISIEITNFTDDADMQKKADEAWTWFKTFLTTEFFNSHMPPEPPAATGGGIMDRLTSLFGAMPQTANLTQMQPTRAGAAQAPTTGTPAAGLSDQVPSTTQSVPAQAAARTPGASGSAGGGNLASELSPFRVGLSLKFKRQDERITRTFDFRMTNAVERSAHPSQTISALADGLDLDSLIQTIDLDDPFFDQLITKISMGQDLAALGINSVALNLEYPAQLPAGGERADVGGFLFRPDTTDTYTFATFLNEDRDRDFRYNMTITFDPTTEWIGADSQIKTPWITSGEREITLAPIDEVEQLDVAVGMSTLLNDKVALVEVDVAYENPATGFVATQTFPLTAGAASHAWKLRLADGAPKTFKHRKRYFFAEGNTRVETDWEEQTTPTVVVNPPFRNVQRLTINPMLLDAANLLQAIVDIRYVEPDTGYRVTLRETFDAGQPLVSRSHVIDTLAEDPADISYDFTLLKADGTVFTQMDQTVDTGVIVLTEGDGAVQRITVKLPSDALPAGSIAVRAEITGDPTIGDKTAALFTPSQLGQQIIALAQPDATTRDYSFEITSYDSAGQPSQLASGTADDTVFIMPL